VAHCLLLMNHK